MTVIRSPRLEALLGDTQLATSVLEYRHLELLTSGKVGEAEDLDYKSALYGNSNQDKRDLCGDVAALANTRGGLLILGIAEDAQGRADQMYDVPLSDAEATRMHQIIANLGQLPPFEIIPVENPSCPGTGCYVIAVAAGPRQPYGVPINDGYRYPRRIGTTIGYLTDAEIETAYRRRDTARRDQAARALEIEDAAFQRFDSNDPWLMVSLVPDQPSDARIDWTTFKAARTFYQGSSPLLVGGPQWTRVRLGQRRYLLDASSNEDRIVHRMAAELYADGSGVFAMPGAVFPTAESEKLVRFSDEHVVITLLSGLRFLAAHARDEAAAAGTVALRATVTRSTGLPWQLCHTRSHGVQAVGTEAHHLDFKAAEAATSLDDLVDGPGLVSAAALLTDELFQTFGLPETWQITTSGQLRIKYWDHYWGTAMKQWAQEHDVEVTNEVLN